MPVDYTIDTAVGVIFVCVSGTLTKANVLQFRERLLADPNFSDGTRMLTDFSSVDDFQISSDDEAELIFHASKTELIFKTAFVAPSDLAFGMMRIYEAKLGENFEDVCVFRTMAAAREWLGLDQLD